MHEASIPPVATHSLDFRSLIKEAWLDQPALETDGRVISYRELKAQVGERALALGRLLKEGEFLALEIERSPLFVINLLASLSIGAVVAPIDPALPESRRNWMLKAIQPRLHVLADQDLLLPNRPALSTVRAGDAHAYLFFTSGSTGEPKAILGSREGLGQFVRWQGGHFNVGLGDRVSFLTALGFDVALRDILLPLFHGATLVVPQQIDVATPQATVQWLAHQRITRVHAVPSMARLWGVAAAENKLVLETFFLAGEKLSEPLFEELRSVFRGVRQWVNFYGPTETTLARFYQSIADPITQPARASGIIAVGVPLPDTEFHLIAEDRKESDWHLPDNGVNQGEVVIVALNTSFGYLDAPQMTDERFRVLDDGRTAYRTGDLGTLTEDGSLVIIGRLDDEVKINGVRVHPQEVENIIGAADSVREVAVIADSAINGDVRLLAFWVSAPGAFELEDNSPRSYALSKLPRAFVPTIWRRVESLPLNINGKLDRKSLLALVARDIQPDRLEGDIEARWLLETVARLLGVDQVHLKDDFFALGGSSLQVAFLIGKIEQQLNKQVDFAPIFEQSSLAAIARLLQQAPISRPVLIKAVPQSIAYQLSPQQRRWWNIYLPYGNRSWATMVRSIPLSGQFGVPQVRKAMERIVAAQVSMQLYFSQEPGVLQQHIHHSVNVPEITVVLHDLSDSSAQVAKKSLEDIRLQIANQEIDPFVWPLFRTHVVRLPGAATQVVFAIHHMISDGFSVGLIETALRTQLESAQPYAPDLPFNYLDYAQWALEEEPRAFGPGSAASEYWKSVMDPPYQKVIFSEQWRGPEEDRGRSFCQQVPQSLRQAVSETARREHLTEFSIYLAAKFLAWHESLDRDDLVIGTPAAGRDISGTQELLGNFISLVCVRSRVRGGGDFVAYVREIMHSVARAMTYQGYQYDTLVQSLNLPLEQDRFPLTTLFISYLNFEGIRARPLAVSEIGHTDLGFAVKFDVMAYVREHQGATSLQIQYRNNLFQSQEIEVFTKRWLSAIERITA